MPIFIIVCECLVVACEQVLSTDRLLLAKVDLTEAFQGHTHISVVPKVPVMQQGISRKI